VGRGGEEGWKEGGRRAAKEDEDEDELWRTTAKEKGIDRWGWGFQTRQFFQNQTISFFRLRTTTFRTERAFKKKKKTSKTHLTNKQRNVLSFHLPHSSSVLVEISRCESLNRTQKRKRRKEDPSVSRSRKDGKEYR